MTLPRMMSWLARAQYEVANAMNRVGGDVGEDHDPFVAAAGRRVLADTEW